MLNVALLDDYARVGLEVADWSALDGKAQLTVFDRHLSQEQAATELQPFDVLCTVRERMSLPRSLIECLSRLRLITIIGPSLPNLDLDAATDHGVIVSHSSLSHPAAAHITNATPELTWGLLIATVRRISHEGWRMRQGAWQSAVGVILEGRTLGLLGLGRIGRRMAEYGRAFGMEVIAWSQNLTAEAAAAVHVRRVEKDELFRRADIVSIHVRLSERTRGLVTARELHLMKPDAYLINTSRGPIVLEQDLITALRSGQIAGAGLDVFDQEPPPPDHPFRTMDNVTVTPHLGYVTRETLGAFYSDTVAAVAAFAAGNPIRVANPQVLARSARSRS
jgi:phosphoglycerate dehydrogenase-like enzyme